MAGDRTPGQRRRPPSGAGSPGREGGSRERRGDSGAKRGTWDVSSGTLPRWIAEELGRVTPRARLTAATEQLTAAAEAFAAGKHEKAFRLAEAAKALSPRDATVRELMALSAYRTGKWETALRELRTYRRYTGDTSHMAVEMDVLRALDRPDDVDAAWDLLKRLGGTKEARDEARVVYGAHLLDRGEPRRAWEATNPGRLSHDANESDMRVWYVAARAAARLGDTGTARKLLEAIQRADAGFPALDRLEKEIRGA